METLFTGLVAVCLIVGIFFAAVGVIGILKFPDFFARSQASTCITTMGAIGAVLAGIFYCAYHGLGAVWYVKLVMIVGLILISSAVAGHSLSKGSYKRGHRPNDEVAFDKDDYEEDGYDEWN